MTTGGPIWARKVLGLDKAKCTLTREIVEKAFRAAVKHNHPDVATMDDKSRIYWSIDAIKDARKILVENLDGSCDFSCKLCKGVGMVRATIGWLKCSACKGTGEKR